MTLVATKQENKNGDIELDATQLEAIDACCDLKRRVVAVGLFGSCF